MRRRTWFTALLLAATAGCGSTVATPTTEATLQGGAPTPGDAGLAAPAATTGAAQAGARTVGGAVAVPSTGAVAAGGGSAPAATATGPSGAPAAPEGSSVVHGPLEVGILYTINDAAAPAGIQNGNTVSPDQVVHALVDSYNKSGGIAGRHIDPVYFAMHSDNNNYEQQIGAACASFTQDNRVAVVLTVAGYYSEQLLSCLSNASVPLISGDAAGADRYDARKYPGFVAPVTLVGEDQQTSVVTHLAAAGWLTHSNHVGVIIEDCPVDNRAYHNGLAPALAHAGAPVAATYETQCFQSIQDFGTETSQMSNAVVQFRSKHVDRVMVVSAAAEANIVFAFSEVADNQHWYPGYALSSIAYPEALAQNAPRTQLAKMRGVGWLPELDSVDRRQTQPDAAGRECVNRVRAQGVQPQSNTDYVYVLEPCDTFRFLDAVARASNGLVSLASVSQHERTVAGSLQVASTVSGRLRMWSDGSVGADQGRLFAFINGAFKYASQPFTL